MMTREQVTAVLERSRPFLQADGGDIELVAMRANSATLRITGVLDSEPLAAATCRMARALRAVANTRPLKSRWR